jgi:hypothetical protein
MRSARCGWFYVLQRVCVEIMIAIEVSISDYNETPGSRSNEERDHGRSGLCRSHCALIAKARDHNILFGRVFDASRLERCYDYGLKKPRGVCFVGLMADRNGIRALPAPAKLGSKIQRYGTPGAS